jgi:hypothetical protein
MMAFAVPASATPTQLGSCTGQLTLLKFTPNPLTDVTQIGEKIAGGLAKDQTTHLAINGTCKNTGGTGLPPARPGDSHIPQPGAGTGALKSMGVSLLGNGSCASAANDPASAFAYPFNGKITWTATQTYNDLVTTVPHNYKIPSVVALLGFTPGGGADQVDVGGIVAAGGLIPGATVKGSVWEDPVTKTGGPAGYNTGYEVDFGNAVGCADATPGNASIAQVLSGGGAGTSTSLIGTTGVPGLSFQVSE